MSVSTEQLLEWKEQIAEAGTEKTVLETQLKDRMKELEDSFSCVSLRAAEKLLEDKQQELHKDQETFDGAVNELQSKFDLD